MGDFFAFMRVFSGQEKRQRQDQLRLLRSAFGIWFLHPGQDFDLDSATFNRCYNVYLDRENARVKKTARHKWNGSPLHLDLDLMIWVFGRQLIKDWTLGPFNTLRYVAGGCVYSLTDEERTWFSREGDKEMNMERRLDDTSIEGVQEDKRRRAIQKKFIRDSYEPLIRNLQDRMQNSRWARFGNRQHSDVDIFKKKWDEMRLAGLPMERWGPYLREQVTQEEQVRKLQQNETLLKQLGRKWMEEEEERKKQRETLQTEFGELLHNYWYKERGMYGGSGGVEGQCLLFDLTTKVTEAIVDLIGQMPEHEQMLLDYDTQNHVVWLQDLEKMLGAMTNMGYGRCWGHAVPVEYILPSNRRQDLWSLQATQEDDFKNSPQWFCTEEQKDTLAAHIAWRAKTKPVMRVLGESENSRWEREQVKKYQEMKRQRDKEGGVRISKYNPLPFTMVDASPRRGRDMLHRSGRDASVRGRHPLPSRPPNIYGGGRGRQRDGRSRSPAARRR